MDRVIVFLIALFALSACVAPDYDEGAAAYGRHDYKTALAELRPLADKGDARAQSILGRMYAIGRGVPQDDAEAVKWYRSAAGKGDAQAQRALGLMHVEGRGMAQDDAEAVKWFRKAAGQRLAAAQGDQRAAEHRDILASYMTQADIIKAQRSAHGWQSKK
jgi:TPR repeat protein